MRLVVQANDLILRGKPSPRDDPIPPAVATGRLLRVLTTMSANWAGSLSRPRVSSGSWNAWVRRMGACPTCPRAASMFCVRTAFATSRAVMLRAANSWGSSQARTL